MDSPRLAEVPNVPIRTLVGEISTPYTIQIRVYISYIEKVIILVGTLLLHKLEVSIQVIALVLQDPLTYISFLLKHLTNVITRQFFPRFLDGLLQLLSVLAIGAFGWCESVCNQVIFASSNKLVLTSQP